MYFLGAPCSIRGFNLLMNHHHHQFILLYLYLLFFNVEAQNPSNQYELGSQDAVSNFQPSLAVVIGILSIMFSLTLVLLLYAKYCHRSASSSVHNNNNNHLQIEDGLLRSRSRFSSSGIDKTVIESLPFFRFSSLKGSREGLECSICLSRFEDVEILRLLPKCKHGFHIDCLDRWLEKHSSCPLCRNKVSADDNLSALNYSNSLRFLWNHQSERKEDSGIELFIQREGSRRGSSSSSSRFSSFRKTENNLSKGKIKNEEELPIQIQIHRDENYEGDRKALHKYNHRIVVSDVVLKHRWSSVSSSDLMILNSEMLQQISRDRFSELGINKEQLSAQTKLAGDGEIVNLKEEMGRKRDFESKLQSKLKQNIVESETKAEIWENSSKMLITSDKRSMSEITVHPRFPNFSNRNTVTSNGLEPSLSENSVKEERIRRIWLPIARRTVEWFANRERRTTSSSSQITRQPSIV